MDFEEYQAEAAKTDDLPEDTALQVAFLGLGGEAGSLLTEYKKHLRDGPAHERFPAAVTEELGDVLWYVATVACQAEPKGPTWSQPSLATPRSHSYTLACAGPSRPEPW